MKLIKINTDHYIIVDDSEIKEGDWTYHHVKGIYEARVDGAYTNQKKITHSTQPLEVKITDEGIHLPDWSKVKALLPREVKELIGVVDVEKNMWYERNVQNPYSSDSLLHTGFNKGFELGYKQALEDNKDKKYTEEDIYKAYRAGMQFVGEDKGSLGEFIQSLQPKTEWEVEIVDGKLKLM